MMLTSGSRSSSAYAVYARLAPCCRANASARPRSRLTTATSDPSLPSALIAGAVALPAKPPVPMIPHPSDTFAPSHEISSLVTIFFLGHAVIVDRGDASTERRRRPIVEFLRGRAEGGRVQAPPGQRIEDPPFVVQIGPKRRAGLQDDVRGGVIEHAVHTAGPFDLHGLGERPAPHGVDEARRDDVKMDVDGVHGANPRPALPGAPRRSASRSGEPSPSSAPCARPRWRRRCAGPG